MELIATVVLMTIWLIAAPIGWLLGRIAAIFTDAAEHCGKQLEELDEATNKRCS